MDEGVLGGKGDSRRLMENRLNLLRKYRDIGVKMTPQRLAILEIMEGNRSHPSAQEVYGQLLEVHPTASFATVYNTLEMLKRMGLVRDLTIDRERVRYDPDVTPHHHAICSGCGRIFDVSEDDVPKVGVPSGLSEAFEVTGHHIEFYGICMGCRENALPDALSQTA